MESEQVAVFSVLSLVNIRNRSGAGSGQEMKRSCFKQSKLMSLMGTQRDMSSRQWDVERKHREKA